MADEETFLQQLMSGMRNSPVGLAASGGSRLNELLLNQIEGDEVFDPSSAEKEELEAIANADPATMDQSFIDSAQEELNNRAKATDMSFLEIINDDYAGQRVDKTMVAAIPRMSNSLVYGLPGLVQTGVGQVQERFGVGDEDNPTPIQEAAMENLNRFGETNRNINDTLNISDPISPKESLSESFLGALVPGGLGAKVAGVGTDFAVDQIARELTDDGEVEYETVFDRANVPETVPLGPLVALPTAVIATSFGASAIARMRTSHVIKPRKLTPLSASDSRAPTDILSDTNFGDLLFSNNVDSQTALSSVLYRAGVPAANALDQKITLDTGAAVSARVREGSKTGRFIANGRQYNVPVPTESLYNAFKALAPDAQKAVSDYVNLRDMIDDARIAMNNDLPGNHGTTIAQHTMRMRRIENDFPIAVEFSQNYNLATRGLRDFLEGDIFDANTRVKLDQERPNYVPFYRGNIDYQAPFVQRIRQSMKDGEIAAEDSFVLKRGTNGNYDVNMRPDPFSILFEHTENSLKFGLANDVRKAYVDELLTAPGPSRIRLVKESDDMAHNQNRIVEVYRNGKKEQYITDSHIAGLLRFDPNIAKVPLLYGPRRLKEQFLTGAASPFFAGTSLLRDTIGANVLREAGTSVPSLMEMGSAIPKQVAARSARAIATKINAGILSDNPTIPFSIWPMQARQRTADWMSQHYLNTYYHMAQDTGGIDASIMKTNIEAAKSTMSELARSMDEAGNNSAVTRLVKDYGYGTMRSMFKMWEGFYNSVLDAPRMAAFEKMVREGMTPAEAARRARNIVGDTSRSGQRWLADGKPLSGDIGEPSALSLLEGPTRAAATIIGEGSPYVNPMVQGTRKLIEAVANDPIGTNLRAWYYVGLPTVAAYGWNEMLGPEYNDYAFEQRSARDVAMTIPIGIPGKPPEEMIEYPIMHELLPFAAPFSAAIRSMSTGTERDEMAFMNTQIAKTIAENAFSIDAPVAIDLGVTLAGGQLPAMFSGRNMYTIREDNIGILPENMETAYREMFGLVGSVTLETATIMANPDIDTEEKYDAFWNEMFEKGLSGMPITKNVTGRKTANTYFSFPAEYSQVKEDAVSAIWPYWREFYDEKYQTTHGFMKPGSGKDYTKPPSSKLEGLYEGLEIAETDERRTEIQSRIDVIENADMGIDDLPFALPGPSQMERPTNPLFDMFGERLINEIRRNDIGMSGLDDRISKYGQYIQLLKGYNSGNREAIAEWQTELEAIQAPDKYEKPLQEMIEDYELDLTDRRDRMKLVNLIHNERSMIISERLEVIDQIEKQITQELQAAGLIKPSDNFEIEHHMKPFDDKPFGITRDVMETFLQGQAQTQTSP